MIQKLFFNKVLKKHVIIWIIYIIYSSLVLKFIFDFPYTINFFIQTIIQRLGDVALFYVNALVIFPKFFKLKKWYYSILTFIILITSYLFYKYSLEFYVFQYLSITIPNDKPIFSQVLTQSIAQANNITIFSIGYYFSQRVIQQQKEIAQKEVEIANQKAIVAEQQVVLIKKEKELVEEREKNAILAKEKAQAEMAFLRAQINPHFLFNTLNLIYSKILTSTKEIAADTMLEFSKMMQYATGTKMQEDTVDLSGELEFAKQYISLFKARNRQGAYINFEEEGYFGSHRVVPMVLITMVENALKHGLIDDPSNPIIIRASLIDDFFVFMVRNLKNPYKDGIAGQGNTGVGVPNIKKRLNAVYKKGGFTLESEDLKDDYIATFTVNYKII